MMARDVAPTVTYEVHFVEWTAEARRMAAAAKNPSEKADFLEVERGWLSLALRYEGPSSPPKER